MWAVGRFNSQLSHLFKIRLSLPSPGETHVTSFGSVQVRVCVCVRARARACVRACVSCDTA